jgi:hypothetical protein
MHRCKNWKEIYLYINDLSRWSYGN